MAIPYALVRLDGIDSTQDEARRRHDDRPVLVVAGRQERGRGRGGSDWISAPRALATSLAFQSPWPAATLPRLTLVAGLAARRALDDRPGLKWPNDLLLAGRKIGGILVESDGELVVAGLGVNLWWPDPPPGVGALEVTDPGAGQAEVLARRWAEDLMDRLLAGPDGWGLEEYRRACLTLDERVSWEPDGEGIAVDVAPSGALVVKTPEGRRELHAGEVRHLSPLTDSYNAEAADPGD